ncbi:MAG: hypothetical protein UHO11_05040 [Treponema sp.]|nr:hypothetical protein [Treponema sp.]
MKRFIFALAAVVTFVFCGCSDNQDLENAKNLLTAEAVASLNSNGKKVPVEIIFDSSRTLESSFYSRGESASWTVVLEDGGDSISLTKDSYGRYKFYAEAGKTYSEINLTGIYTYSTERKFYYSASAQNVEFSFDKKNVLSLTYSLDSVEVLGSYDFYDDSTYEGKRIAYVNLSGGKYDSDTYPVKLVKRGGTKTYAPNEPTLGGWGAYEYTEYYFNASSVDEIEEGLYDFVMEYDFSFGKSKVLFKKHDAIRVLKNVNVEINYYFEPIFDESFYKVSYYATMEQNVPEDNTGLSSESPISINDAYTLCVTGVNKYRPCYIYCDDSFILDYDAVYGSDGLFSKMAFEENSEGYKKTIEIITPKTRYLLTKAYDEVETDGIKTLKIYGNTVSLSGNGVFEVYDLYDYDGNYPFVEWNNNDVYPSQVYNHLKVNLDSKAGFLIQSPTAYENSNPAEYAGISIVVNITNASLEDYYAATTHPVFGKVLINDSKTNTQYNDTLSLFVNGSYVKLGSSETYALDKVTGDGNIYYLKHN